MEHSSPPHHLYVKEFCQVIDYLYRDLLTEAESELLNLLQSLSSAHAWRAITLLSRKSSYFSLLDNVTSPEETETLQNAGLLRPTIDQTPTAEKFSSASRKVLLNACSEARICVKLSAKKLIILNKIVRMKKETDIHRFLQIQEIGLTEEFASLKRLFFGRSNAAFGSFFSRDQKRPFSERSLSSLRPLFENRNQLESVKELEAFSPPWELVEILGWVENIRAKSFLNSEFLKTRVFSLLAKAASSLEKSGDLEGASLCWEQVSTRKGVVGHIKTLRRLGRNDSISEITAGYLAGDTYPTLKKRLEEEGLRSSGIKTVSTRTNFLKSSRIIEITRDLTLSLEEDVCSTLKTQNATAFHTENWLFQIIYLFFCDSLLSPQIPATGLYNTIGHRSSLLYSPTMYENYPQEVEKALSLVTRQWLDMVSLIPSANGYSPKENEILDFFLRLVEVEQVRQLFAEILKNAGELLSGYPDLLVIEGTKIKFIEIKGPGDTLSFEQVESIARLRRCGFEVDVVRVKFERVSKMKDIRKLNKKKSIQLPLFIFCPKTQKIVETISS